MLAGFPGVADLGVFQETGQPELLVSINRGASARYGLMSSDVNAAVQAAIGGLAATQILEGDRRFDFVIRYEPKYRTTPEAIRNILLPTPNGNNVPLGQVADVSLHEGAFMIYRENGVRYIPVKFSVRGRDLAGTIQDVQGRLAQKVHLPEGYHLEWAGEYDSLQKEQRRLAVIIPDQPADDPGAAVHGFQFSAARAACSDDSPVCSDWWCVVTASDAHACLAFSAAVGFASVIGVCTLGSVVFVFRNTDGKSAGASSMAAAIESGGRAEMRPVMMACAAAGLGLLPAAVSSGIGVQAQQPLARVVVGGMVTSPFAILFLIPVLASYWLPRETTPPIRESTARQIKRAQKRAALAPSSFRFSSSFKNHRAERGAPPFGTATEQGGLVVVESKTSVTVC